MLINPLGGSNKKISGILFKTAKESVGTVKKVVTPMDVEAALKDFREKGVNLLIVSGGDGTVQAVLTTLFGKGPFDTLPALAILPGGTTNLIAKDVGICISQKRAIKELMNLLRENRLLSCATLAKRHVLHLNCQDRADEYGMFLGAAGISKAVAAFQKQKMHHLTCRKANILLAAIKLMVASIVGRGTKDHSERLKIRLNGKTILDKRFLLVLVTTLERLFFGIRPFWAQMDGPIHLTAVARRPKYFPKVLLGLIFKRFSKHLTKENGYLSFNAHIIELYAPKGVALDGQIIKNPDPDIPIVVKDGGEVSFIKL